jgi:hypothetical protein
MKFSIRELFLVTVIVALALGWWVDRSRLAEEIDRLQTTHVWGPKPRLSDFQLPTSSAPAPNPPKK